MPVMAHGKLRSSSSDVYIVSSCVDHVTRLRRCKSYQGERGHLYKESYATGLDTTTNVCDPSMNLSLPAWSSVDLDHANYRVPYGQRAVPIRFGFEMEVVT
jgi:hypothetical protein